MALALCGACSVFDPSYTADRPDASGKAPVEVTVDIEGNVNQSAAVLRGRIEDYMFDLSRDPTRESAVYDAALEVEDYYRTEGHPVAKVKYEYSPPDEVERPQSVHVRLLVEEGPLVLVEMTLRGNTAFDTGELLALWSRKDVGLFGLGGVAFVESDVHAFGEQLRAFYRARGRLDAVVGVPQIDVDLDRALAKVAIEIAEGHVHTIRRVEVAPTIRSVLGTALPRPPEGKVCAQDEIQGYRDAVRNALRMIGHPKPRVEVTTEPEPGVPFAWHLRVDGDPGQLATIASVAVAGNQKTMDGIILGKIELGPGDRYDGTSIEETLRRLYRSGLFRKVEIEEKPLDDDPSRLGLTVQVDESDSRSIEFMAGWGSYEQARAGLRLEDTNLFGTGRGLALDNHVSTKGYSTELTLTDSDFLMTDSTLTVSGEYFRREEPSFTDKALGGTVALSRTLTAGTTARVGYTYRDRIDATAFTVLPQDQLVDFVEGKVFLEFRNDRRDNLLFPRKGHAEFVSFERIAPEFGASVDLDRLTFRASKHFHLWRSGTLVLRTEQNGLWPHEGSANVPLQLRWFNGGENSVRSFRESQLGPKDAQGNPTGGEYRNILGAELRFPIVKTLEGGLFVDAGNLGTRVQDFSLDEMRYGIGAGLRLLLPIGAVRLDAAWNPDQDPGDDEWVLHFSVGYPY
jgi:outer membrane protein assembly complex protein YaeT